MGRTKFLAVIGVAALILGACGNDGSNSGEGGSGGGDRSAEDQAYVDEMTAAFTKENADDESFPTDQFECWMGDMADGVGVDKLKEAGLTPESVDNDSSEADLQKLSEDDRKVVAESFTDCVDLEEVFTASMEAESSGEEIPKEMKECFAAIDWEVIEAKFSEMILTGDEMDENDSAMAPLLGCMLGSMGDMDMDDMDTGADSGSPSTTIG